MNSVKPVTELYYKDFDENIEALVDEKYRWTYGQLEAASNLLAARISAYSLESQTPVGIYLPRSSEYVIALLAVLKSGCAFVPLSQRYPLSRLNLIVKDTAMPLCITSEELSGKLENVPELIIDVADCRQAERLKIEPPEIRIKPSDLAYIIYTSGSTGKPKGVEIEHRNLYNMLMAYSENFELKAGSRVTQSADIGFDASLWEIMPALVFHHTLHFITDELLLNIPRLKTWLTTNQIKATFLSTPVAEMLISNDCSEIAHLRYLTVGGDRLKKQPPASLKAKLINVYGPAECCVMVSQKTINSQLEDANLPPIGKPIINTRFYILDEFRKIVKPGETGELYIAGSNVGRGYHNLPEETEAKFLSGRKLDLPEEIVYKTGDLAKKDRNGDYICLGRTDFQIKINGQRIELEEIEAVLNQLTFIKDNTVRVLNNPQGIPRIIAWLIYTRYTQERSLKDALAEKLPAYMIPNHFVTVNSFPLTANGKIDYKKLPEPRWVDQSSEFIEPETGQQEEIKKIWVEILNTTDFGIDNDFFSLGGHSLLAAQVITRLNQQFKCDLPVQIMSSHPTIRELESLISDNSEIKYSQFPKAARQDHYPLSKGQNDLWIIHQLDKTEITHNLMIRLDLWGNLNIKMFVEAIDNVIKKFSLLQASFAETDSRVTYSLFPELQSTVEIQSLTDQAQIKELIHKLSEEPFDLTQAPLFRHKLVELRSDQHIYLLCIHHIITDGWSMGLFISEVSNQYNGLLNKAAISTDKGYTYEDFAVWEQDALRVSEVKEEFEWWSSVLNYMPQPLALAQRSLRENLREFSGQRIWFWIDAEQTKKLKAFARENSTTLFVTMLTVFKLMLYQQSGREDIVIGTPYANRTRRELEDIFGYFTNMVSLFTKLDRNKSLAELTASEHKFCLQAFEKSRYPFGNLSSDLGYSYNEKLHPVFQILFIFQNYPFPEELFPGVRFDFTELGNSKTNIDLTCNITEKSGKLEGWFMFFTEIYSQEYINQVKDQYLKLLDELIQSPLLPVKELINLPESPNNSCWLFGTTSMLVICAELLMENGFYIKGIVSSDQQVRKFAEKYGIPCHDESTDIESLLTQQPFDFLFSIINDIIIPQSVIALAKKAAINYHDSPLPRYAGMYATSWALFNNEREHAVSWHYITPQIDAGDIIVQRKVMISQKDTAHTFNARCFSQAIDAFKELIRQFHSGKITPQKQNLQQRSYYGLYQRHDSVFHLNYQLSAADLERFIRALDFAGNNNEQGIPKLIYHNKFYCLKEAEVINYSLSSPPGNLSIKDDQLIIQTSDLCLKVKKIKDIDGYPVEINQVFEPDQKLTILNPAELDSLKRAYQSSQKREKYWLETLSQYSPLEPFFTDHQNRKKFTENIIPKNTDSCLMILFTALFFDQLEFSVILHEISDKYNKHFFSPHKPLNLKIPLYGKIHSIKQEIHRSLTATRKKAPYARDIFLRYKQLNDQQLSKNALVIDYGDYQAVGDELIIIRILPESVIVQFNSRHFSSTQKDTYLSCWQYFMENLELNPQISISQIELISKADIEHITSSINQSKQAYPLEKNWGELFHASVLQFPDHHAVEYKDDNLTYKQLDALSNGLAARFLQEGLSPGSVIGVCLPRSLNLAVALVTILKTGCTYLPLDPDYPHSRLDYMIRNSNCHFLLTDNSTFDLFKSDDLHIINLEQISDWSNTPFSPPQYKNEIPAYLIYTSGSTGKPKGVLISQRSLINHNFAAIDLYQITSRDRILQFAALSFDISIEEIFPTWLAGACLFFRNAESAQSMQAFSALISEKNISIINLPTAFFHQLASEVDMFAAVPSLKAVIVGGEKVQLELYRKWASHFDPSPRFYNTYGPTEATIIASTCLGNPDINWLDFPIGKPIPNSALFVLDSRKRLRPHGIPGELYICGENVGIGYINNPQLRTQAFPKLPYHPGKSYRTGDLVFYDDKNQLHFYGRKDKQLKIRGYRLEAAGIIKALQDFPAVQLAYVDVYKADSRKILTAWIQAAHLKLEDLKIFLKAKLPEFMIPERFLIMHNIPLTINGKIDTKALPAPSSISDHSHFKEPYNEFQRLLCRVFAKVLDQQSISISDNFFDLGGNSLLAMKALNQLQLAGMELAISDLFKHKDIEELSHYIKYKADSSTSPQKFSLASIRTTKSSHTPLIICHLSPGDLLGYSSLFPEIDPQFSIYGLQAPALIDNPLNFNSIADLATWYIKVLDQYFTSTNYILFGHCFGGTLAYEIASQLEKQNRAPRALVICETWLFPPQEPLARFRYRLHKISNIFRMNPADFLYYLRVKFLKHNPVSPFVEIREHGEDNQLFLQRAQLQNHHLNLILRHHYPKYNGHFHLIIADNPPRGLIPDPTLGWNTVTDNYTIHSVSATHSDIMRLPAVKEIANIIKKVKNS